MKLLFQRGQGQSKILRRPNFSLWAQFEVTDEEASLIDKYQVRNIPLIEGAPGEVKFAAYLSAIPAFIIFVASFNGASALVTFAVAFYIIYSLIRQKVMVGDILKGYTFACGSVVTLMTKEQDIAKMAEAFRHLLETMKDWGGREIIELKPYLPPTSRVLERIDENL